MCLPDHFKPLIMALENCELELTNVLVKGKLLTEAFKYKNDEKECALASKKRTVKIKLINIDVNVITEISLGIKDNAKKSETGLVTTLGTRNMSHEKWYVDPGASVNVTERSDWLRNIKQERGGEIVTTASGEPFKITHTVETILLS